MHGPRPRPLLRALAMSAVATAPLLGAVASACDDGGRSFRAGAATSNVTPMLDTSLAGHMRDRAARMIHDELHARCLVLDDGRTTLAIAIVDSCMIPRAAVLEAKRRIDEHLGIPPERVLIAATHAHSCPTATPAFQSEPVPGYPEFLARRIADGVRRAAANRGPARIGWGVGSNDEQVFNRRWHMEPGTVPPGPFAGRSDRVKMNPAAGSPDLVEPAGPIDPEVWVVAVRAPDGRPIALLANYSLHYVGGTGPGHVSADYFGMFAERISGLLGADRLDPPFVAMMSNGTSGDINNIDFRAPRPSRAPYQQMRLVADDLAREAARVVGAIEFRDAVDLGAAATELELGVRRPDDAESARARAIVDAAEGPEMRTLPEIYARETLLLADYPATVPVTLQALRIGDLGIAAIPCEVFVEIGLEIKRRSPLPAAFTIELANGYNGYLPTPRHHELGGYETWRARSSYLEVDAAGAITDAVLGLMERLAPRSSR